MGDVMELIVNGERKELAVRTIHDVSCYYGLQGKPIVVEADGIILTREQWAETAVKPGMKIELVHFVGGG